MKVMKFGGGCLRNPELFKRVSEVILTEEKKAAVVVSAVFGITDDLTRTMQTALESEDRIRDRIGKIRKKHLFISESLLMNDSRRREVEEGIETRLIKLERLLRGVSLTEEITPSVRAQVLSCGERLAAILLAALLDEQGKAARPLETDQIGLITDDQLDNASALLPEAKTNVAEHLCPLIDAGTVPVLTGFFGRTREGKTSLFGRNGTDYSAAVIAHALDADLLEIWKDVDGFMSADPRVIPGAESIDKLSYYEAAELSYFGAKILYPRTVEPLMEKNIPLRIRNLLAPQTSGTLIQNGGVEREDIVKSITYNKNIAVLRIQGPGVGYKPGIIADIGRRLSDLGINIFSVITSQTCINLLLDRSDCRKSFRALESAPKTDFEKIEYVEDIALVGIVGQGLSKGWGIAARVFSAVAGEKINVEMISSGASDAASYFIVREEHLDTALRAVHHEFFNIQPG